MDGPLELPQNEAPKPLDWRNPWRLPLNMKELREFLNLARYMEPSHLMRERHKAGKVYDRESKDYV